MAVGDNVGIRRRINVRPDDLNIWISVESIRAGTDRTSANYQQDRLKRLIGHSDDHLVRLRRRHRIISGQQPPESDREPFARIVALKYRSTIVTVGRPVEDTMLKIDKNWLSGGPRKALT